MPILLIIEVGSVVSCFCFFFGILETLETPDLHVDGFLQH